MAVNIADDSNKRFTGHERDSGSSLDYMIARYYDADANRFLSVDPLLSSSKLWQPHSWNRYLYVLGSPVVYMDPDGREAYMFRDSGSYGLGLVRHGGMVIRDPSNGKYIAFDFRPDPGTGASFTVWDAEPGRVLSGAYVDSPQAATMLPDSELSEMILTTPEEDQALIDYWLALEQDPPLYAAVGSNCYTISIKGLEDIVDGYWMFLEGMYTGWSWRGINASFRHHNRKRKDELFLEFIGEHGWENILEWDRYRNERFGEPPTPPPAGPAPPNLN